jgi:hypothetical protein
LALSDKERRRKTAEVDGKWQMATVLHPLGVEIWRTSI